MGVVGLEALDKGGKDDVVVEEAEFEKSIVLKGREGRQVRRWWLHCLVEERVAMACMGKVECADGVRRSMMIRMELMVLYIEAGASARRSHTRRHASCMVCMVCMVCMSSDSYCTI